MVPNIKKIEVLKIILNGGTLSEAGAAIGVSQTSASGHISRICKVFELPRYLKYIRSNKDKYLNKINEFREEPKIGLRSALIRKLMHVLRLKSESDLTPKYISNITASQLMNAGITPVAVVEINEWLSHFQLSLKLSPPQNDQDLKKVKQAIAILEVFHFDTKVVCHQLSHFLNGS